MDVLIITGGIGSGKSEVCRIIQEMTRCGVYNADSRVKDLYVQIPGLLDEIELRLHTPLRGEDGKFEPRLLAQVIFSDREALEMVESIVFPALVKDFTSWSENYTNDRFVVFESATVLEKPQFDNFGDKVILVDAPYTVRLERACKRDSASRENVAARMDNQKLMNRISNGETVPRADVVINNAGDIQDLKTQVVKSLEKLYY